MNNSVIVLSSYQSKYAGNFIPSLLQVQDELQANDIQCIMVLPLKAADREWFKILEKKVKIITVDFNVKKKTFIKEIINLSQMYSANTIYAHFGKFIEVELACLLKKRLHGIIHIHSDFSMGKVNLKEKIYRYFVYKLLPIKVRFISVSPAFVNYNPKKIKYISNALATKRIECIHEGGESVRKKLGLVDKDILCEIYGWSPEVKGVDIAVQIVGQLIERYSIKNLKLAIVVGEKVGREAMIDFISQHTDYSGKENYLFYLDPTEDVLSYHEAADILLLTSRSEGFPYVPLEIMSMGKKCVASDMPGTTWMREYKTAFLFDNSDFNNGVKALYEAIRMGREVDAEIGKRVRDQFSIDKWAKQVAGELIKYANTSN